MLSLGASLKLQRVTPDGVLSKSFQVPGSTIKGRLELHDNFKCFSCHRREEDGRQEPSVDPVEMLVVEEEALAPHPLRDHPPGRTLLRPSLHQTNPRFYLYPRAHQ